ncbi:MAG: hypothetical protein NHG13_00945 [Candidatus Shikimatogenerans bostrichidophilus]|nr:MAG: hypothetical protein NHG13_00945 [Candidatus Shikimatogenerans bostrichidophilus]
MIKNLIINVKKKKKKIAILDDKKLIEIYDLKKDSINIGDILVGKIIYIYKGINAVLVDIGYKKYGFLNYNDIGDYFLFFKKKKIKKKKKKKKK